MDYIDFDNRLIMGVPKRLIPRLKQVGKHARERILLNFELGRADEIRRSVQQLMDLYRPMRQASSRSQIPDKVWEKQTEDIVELIQACYNSDDPLSNVRHLLDAEFYFRHIFYPDESHAKLLNTYVSSAEKAVHSELVAQNPVEEPEQKRAKANE